MTEEGENREDENWQQRGSQLPSVYVAVERRQQRPNFKGDTVAPLFRS
jgi:hypothetical protein